MNRAKCADHLPQRLALGRSHHTVLSGILSGVLLLAIAGCAFPSGASTARPRAPTPTATSRPPTAEEVAAQMVAQMSLDEKLGQMLIMEFLQPTSTTTEHQLVGAYHPGGVVLARSAMGTAQQVKALLASGQRDSAIPLFTFLDLEGGAIDPLATYLGGRISPSQMSATGAPALAQAQGAKVAQDLLSFGFNVDLAPSLNPGVGLRSFGATPEQVTTYGGAWLMGLQTTGVLGCANDFPAVAGTVELAPYRTLIASGQLQLIMTTTAVIGSIDPTHPAALSRPLVTGLLRNELQFTGVVITDALYATSVVSRFSFAQAAVMAVEAGVDMINGVWSPTVMRDIVAALKAAIASGKLSEQQVDTAVTRILTLKLRAHIIAMPNGAATAG